MKKLKTFIDQNWKLLTVAIFAIVTFLSLYPLPEFPAIPGKDKTEHVIAYAAFAFPVSFAKPRNYLWILILIVLWGGTMELIQPYVNRYREFYDLLANTTGVFLGFIIARLVSSLLKK